MTLTYISSLSDLDIDLYDKMCFSGAVMAASVKSCVVHVVVLCKLLELAV